MRTKQTRDLPDRRNICLSGLTAMLSTGSMALWPHRLAAQAPEQSDNQVRVGDWWTYATKDEITGIPTQTYTQVVTGISATQIIVSASTLGKKGFSITVFDRDWNRVEIPNVRFIPHNGTGIRPSMDVGKEWRTDYEIRRDQTGFAFKDSVSSKVVAQEAITSPAGTFDGFKIETRKHEISAADPAQFWDYEYVRWYAPQINHWVRWLEVDKEKNRLRSRTSEELIAFGRKE